MKGLGHRIRALRNEKGISRIEFAEAIGITYSAASKYESNARMPGIKTLIKMADYFDVSADFLLGREK
ncbi:MAG: helix-turn-helix transcriptional regulator [Bacillota bacterium]|nr:helix-turn-helix transcriptional regulator [Bacillota bacterium]